MLVMVNDDRKSYYTFVVIMVVAVSITLFFNQKQKVHNAIPLCGKITAYVSFLVSRFCNETRKTSTLMETTFKSPSRLKVPKQVISKIHVNILTKVAAKSA